VDQKARIHSASDEPADIVPEAPASAPAVAPRYFNRELSWLAFNRRVLEEAGNPSHPLLERVRFLSISASNLDEFFMVRVAGLKAHQALGVEEFSIDGLTPSQQLNAINGEADALVKAQHDVWATLQRELDAAGMPVIGDEPLDAESHSGETRLRPADWWRCASCGTRWPADASGWLTPASP